jgi:hypothetical protein
MLSLYDYIRTNDITQIKELLSKGVQPDVYGLGEAILYNHLEIVNLFLPYNIHTQVSSETDAVPYKNLLNYCIIANNKSLLVRLMKTISPDKSTFLEAINNFDMELMSTIITHGVTPDLEGLIRIISNPLSTLEFIQFVLSHMNDLSSHVIDIEEETYQFISPLIVSYLKEKNIQLNVIRLEN